MNDTGLAALEIARLEERRQAVDTREIALDSEEVGGGIMAYAGVGSWANQACGLGLDGSVSDDDLDRLVDYYVSRGIEPRIEVCSLADKTLIDGLAARGFVTREFEHVLARSLSPDEDLRAQHPYGWPAHVRIEPVDRDDAEQVDAHVRVAASGFFDDPAPAMLESMRRATVHPRAHALNAIVDGEIAATGSMGALDEVACLFGATVRPRYRRRGLQLALILERLVRAQELGCRVVCIHSAPGIPTERNAARVGFALTYVKAIQVRPGEGLAPSP